MATKLGYIHIQPWMREELDLKGNELLVYALIQGFSQEEQGCFWGSIDYISKACGCGRNTTIRTLKSLQECGLIHKREVIEDGVRRCQYTAIVRGSPKMGLVPKWDEGSPKMGCEGSPKMGHNNKLPSSDNKKISKATATLDLPFSSDKFRDVWEMLCEEKEWKKKTKNALRLALKDLGKYDEEFAIELMEKTIKNGWRGVVFADTDAKYQEWKSARQHAAENQTPRTTQATRARAVPQNNQIDDFYRKQREQAEAEREAQIAALKAKYGNTD